MASYLWGSYYKTPEPLTIGKANEHVDELVRTLQGYFESEYRIVVTEVVKGGSVGQGTPVPGDFDLDLVLYSRDIDPVKVVREGVGDVVSKLEDFLKRHFRANCQDLQKTGFGLKFKFHQEIDVDLLPSPYWENKHDLYTFLSRLNASDRRKFSCSAAKYEKYFFQRQPQQVKEYIRRAKKWRNDQWPDKHSTDGRPKSILISVLMAAAYGRSQSSDAKYVEVEFKRLVKNHRSLRIDLEGEAGRYPTAPPYILDPANAFNNLYISGINRYEGGWIFAPTDGNWTAFVRNIDTLDLTRAV